MRTFIALVAVFLVACSGGAPQVWIPGTTNACTCANGQSGAQSCDAEGAGFGACTCTAPARMRVFTTSLKYPAALGGLTGADAKCNAAAQAAGLPGTYKAWLSDGYTNALTRLV